MGNLLALCMARTKNITTKVQKINLLLKTVDQARPTMLLMKIQPVWSALVHLVNFSYTWPAHLLDPTPPTWHLLQVRSGEVGGRGGGLSLSNQSSLRQSFTKIRPVWQSESLLFLFIFFISSLWILVSRHLWLLVNKRFNLKIKEQQFLSTDTNFLHVICFTCQTDSIMMACRNKTQQHSGISNFSVLCYRAHKNATTWLKSRILNELSLLNKKFVRQKNSNNNNYYLTDTQSSCVIFGSPAEKLEQVTCVSS